LDFPELNVHLIRAHHKPSSQHTTQSGTGPVLASLVFFSLVSD
jgi:hypothetical protein